MYIILYSYLLSKSVSPVAKWVWLLYLCRCHVWVALLPLAGDRWRRPLHPLFVALGGFHYAA